MDRSHSFDAPLSGIRVLDFGQFIAAPGAAMMLAGLGADVIKVEPPGGDLARSSGDFGDAIFFAYNRNKRGIALDLKSPGGRDAALRLVAGADVLVQNMRPGGMERLGLGAAELRAAHPGLVYASVTAFGDEGPGRERRGFDIAAQAESGMMSITGEEGGQPLKTGFAVVDAAASYLLAQAVLAALVRRGTTGKGAEISLSLLDVALHLQMQQWSDYALRGVVPARAGNKQPTAAPAADLIATRDGHIVLSAYTPQHWRRLCDVIGRPELADDARFATNQDRVAHRPELLAVLGAALSERTSEECVALLTGAELVAGAVKSYPEVLAGPDVAASGLFGEVAHASGAPVPAIGMPYRLDGGRGPSGTAPALGQDTAEVLREAGFTEAETVGLMPS